MQKSISTMTVGDLASLAQQVVQTTQETNNAVAKSDVTFLNLKTETELIMKALLRERDKEKTKLRQEQAKTLLDFFLRLRRQVFNEQHSPIEEVATSAKNLIILFDQLPSGIRIMKPEVRTAYLTTLRNKLKEEPHTTEVDKANMTAWVEKFDNHLVEYSKLTLKKSDTKYAAKTTATASALKPAIRAALKHYINFVKGRAKTTKVEEWMTIDSKIDALCHDAARKHAKQTDLAATDSSTTETAQKVTA